MEKIHLDLHLCDECIEEEKREVAYNDGKMKLVHLADNDERLKF
jgi:hypothetical protein